MGSASRWWLHHSLQAFSLKAPLLLCRGDPRVIIPRMVADSGASGVVWNRRYEPWSIRRDTELKDILNDAGIIARSFNGGLLYEPWTLRNKSLEPFKVFTPFWKHCMTLDVGEPVAAPQVDWVKGLKGDRLEDWHLLPDSPNWAAPFSALWTPGEDGARARLRDFVQRRLKGYGEGRDRPDLEHSSRLSPHLHFGEVSPREVFCAVKKIGGPDADKFLSELGWREFAHHLLFHFPRMLDENWKPEFNHYPWQDNRVWIRAWQRGRTGYPLVDAGMRELWATGTMHNRVRMVAASFLVKHLRAHWKHGEEWFWDTLLDADAANNVCGWQWVAGCGADAAPYFRIFNPMEQGRRFDPHGHYVRRWLPELAGLPNEVIHAPWEAGPGVLERAGVRLGKDYPTPIVQHAAARKAALDGLAVMRAG